jgi:hypothetical protein
VPSSITIWATNGGRASRDDQTIGLIVCLLIA